MKTCKKCLQNKPYISFCSHKNTTDGLNPVCRDCVKIYNAEYYKINKDEIRLTQKVWNSKNIDKNKKHKNEYQKKWRADNPDKVAKHHNNSKSYQKTYGKENRAKITKQQADRLINNPLLKLKKVLRNRLLIAIKSNYKNGSAVKDLGCSIRELKIYLESKFQPGMTWENHRIKGWHIDHIVPLSKFDLSNKEEFLKACHYTNLQPLWALDNILKGNS